MTDDLLVAEDLAVHFPVYSKSLTRRRIGFAKAVDGVSFTVRRGETLGLVGESGCGKTTTGFAVLKLIELTAGRILFDGEDITRHGGKELRDARRRMSLIFQDPYSSLDPRMSIGSIVAEPLEVCGLHGSRAARWDRVGQLFEMVGLNPDFRSRFPHQFSGGQRQRVGIARALAGEPEFIVCDEPIASLDVSIQAQILNLLMDLQEQFGLTYLFISHDLSAVRHVCDRVAVMYMGRIVETGGRDVVQTDPKHPYTRALVSAVPVPNPLVERARTRTVLKGDVPSALSPPSGCRFRTRCPSVFDPCPDEYPRLQEVKHDHSVACYLYDESVDGLSSG